jgi:hypothetical protein
MTIQDEPLVIARRKMRFTMVAPCLSDQQCQTATRFTSPRGEVNTTSRSRDASASELCQPSSAHDPEKLALGPDPRVDFRFSDQDHAQTKKEAKRRQACSQNDRAIRARRAAQISVRGLRTPDPPGALACRCSAAALREASQRLLSTSARASWDAVSLSQSSDMVADRS